MHYTISLLLCKFLDFSHIEIWNSLPFSVNHKPTQQRSHNFTHEKLCYLQHLSHLLIYGDFWEIGSLTLAWSHTCISKHEILVRLYPQLFQPSLCFSDTAMWSGGRKKPPGRGAAEENSFFSKGSFSFQISCLLIWDLSAKVLWCNIFLGGERLTRCQKQHFIFDFLYELETHRWNHVQTHLWDWKRCKGGHINSGTCLWMNTSFSFSSFFQVIYSWGDWNWHLYFLLWFSKLEFFFVETFTALVSQVLLTRRYRFTVTETLILMFSKHLCILHGR